MKKFKLDDFLKKRFAIEYDVDITDDTAMLYRRNLVVKNIIFFSNLVYTFIFLLLSISEKTSTNIVITAILVPVTLVVNHTLKKLMTSKPDDKVSQVISSYFCIFYLFLLAAILYIKMRMFTQTSDDGLPIYADAAYVLIYYSLIVMSLYQNAKMILNTMPYVIVGVSILHFVTTHGIVAMYKDAGALDFAKTFLTSPEFRDILVRTLLLVAFLVVLYASVYLSARLQEQRKTELIKRRGVQADFTKVVTDMFDITLSGSEIPESEHIQGPLLEKMCVKLASIIGLTPDETEEIRSFSTIHLHARVDLDVSQIEDQDAQFEKLREQTAIGNEIIRRLELRRKCNDIYRAHSEGWANEEFTKKTKEIQNDQASLVILMCELYINLRSPNNYKRPFNHNVTMDLIEKEYKIYFDDIIFDRFNRFASDFEDMFNNFE